MSKQELIDVIKELYKLWYTQDSDEDIDFILNVVMQKIKNEESEGE